MADKTEVNVPFVGFYGTHYSSGIDRELSSLEREIEDEYPHLEDYEVEGSVQDNFDNSEAEAMISRAYVSEFAYQIRRVTGLEVEMEFSLLTHPREYNFTTDRIFALISEEDFRSLYAYVGVAAVQAEAKKHFTSHDGFISFYDPDVSTWGDPIEDWDSNQRMTVLAALLSKEHEDIEFGIFMELAETLIGEAVWNCIDFSSLHEELAAKEAEAVVGLAEQPDNRKFPRPAPVDEYVAQFLDMNHLKGD